MAPFEEALLTMREVWPSNGDYLDDLKERLTGAQPIPLLPFVGAGLSMPMGFPSWAGFLKGSAKECGKSGEVAALLGEGKYEEAAEAVEQGLSPEIFNRRIAHTFGKRKSDTSELKGAARALPEMAAGAVVTTNFDRILERVFREAGSAFEHVVWGSQVDSIRQAITENKPFLLKIHGDAEERSGRVLTKREYEKHYAPGEPEGLRAQLARIFQGRTVLFLGCSLGKDRTMDVLSELLRQASGLTHFAVVEKPAREEELFAKQQLLGQRGILPIFYPTGRHELIEPLVRWIASLRPSPRLAAPELVLERPAQRKKEIRSELDLLTPYQRTTEFVGRARELESLRGWLRSEAAVSVRVVTGRGGAGKTRLAIESIEWLDAAEPQQWNCGFLTREEMERFSGLQNLSQWRRRKPVLAVVDYAAGSAERLRSWLEQLAAAESGGEKLRLLLLEREASLEAGWLASAMSRGFSASGMHALLDPREPVRLEAVAGAADRRSVLRATLEAGAANRKMAAPPVPSKGVDALFDQKLEDPQWGDPLTLMMAGLNALKSGLVAAMALGRPDLALHLAGRECDRVARFGQGAPRRLMEHMAAFVTLSGGLSREGLREVARAESEAIGMTHPGGWGALADQVAEALGVGDGTKAVEPDIVGEALLLRVWGGVEVGEGSKAVVRAATRAAKARAPQVAASVMRTAQDFCVGEKPRMEPLAWLDSLIDEAKGELTLLRQIEGQLPLQTLALRERAVMVDRMLAAALRERGEADEEARAERAGVLNNLGVRLSDLERREEALAATNEAVGLYRQLASQRPDAFLPDLTMSLNNLGNALSGLGRREEALEATGEATGLCRHLASERPDAFLPDLAISLNNLGKALSDLERREEALAATNEAVGLYRQLASQRPDAFLPDLAKSLNNLGAMLSGLGRREEALAATVEAVGLYRQLARQRADAFLPDLAMSLNNLGNVLSGLRRLEEALQASDEAVRIRRQLARQRADAFLPDLAMSLNNLGNRLSHLGRREEALEATDEAVRIRRQLASQRPDAFLPDLATSLGAKGAVLQASGNAAEAAVTFRDGIERLKPLFLRLPKAFRRLMSNLVVYYSRASEDAGLELDAGLLADIVPLLSDDQAEGPDR